MSCCGDDSVIDLKNRDPEGVNSHVKVKFNEVIAEPIGNHSCDFMWDASSCCYECWFMICYQVSAVCCGICIAIELGCEFAQVAFLHIWCISPFMRVFGYCLHPFKCCYGLCVKCGCSPWWEACSYLFGAFEDPNRDADDPFRTRIY